MTASAATSGGEGSAEASEGVRKYVPAGAHKPRDAGGPVADFGAMLLASGLFQAGEAPASILDRAVSGSSGRHESKSSGGKQGGAAHMRLATAESTRAMTQSNADRLRTVGPGVSLAALAQAEMAKPLDSAARAELGQAAPTGPDAPESGPSAESKSGQRAGRDAAGGGGPGSANGSPSRGVAEQTGIANGAASANSKVASSPAASTAAGALGALDRLAGAASRVQIIRPTSAAPLGGPVGGVSAAAGAGGRSGVGSSTVPAHSSATPGATNGLGASGPSASPSVGAARGGSPHRAQVPREQLMQQVHRALGLALRSNDGPVTIRLTPEHLGQLRVDLSRGEGGVTARFEVATAEAQKLLEGSMPDLRRALEARGLQVDRLEVRLVDQPGPDAERRTTQESGDQPQDGASGDHGGDRADAGAHANSGGGGQPHGQRSARAQAGDGPGPGKAEQSGLVVSRAVGEHAGEPCMLLSTFEAVA